MNLKHLKNNMKNSKKSIQICWRSAWISFTIKISFIKPIKWSKSQKNMLNNFKLNMITICKRKLKTKQQKRKKQKRKKKQELLLNSKPKKSMRKQLLQLLELDRPHLMVPPKKIATIWQLISPTWITWMTIWIWPELADMLWLCFEKRNEIVF